MKSENPSYGIENGDPIPGKSTEDGEQIEER